MEKLVKFKDFLAGKKSYIVAAVAFVVGGLQAIGYPIPEGVMTILVALGLVTVRAGVAKVG